MPIKSLQKKSKILRTVVNNIGLFSSHVNQKTTAHIFHISPIFIYFVLFFFLATNMLIKLQNTNVYKNIYTLLSYILTAKHHSNNLTTKNVK